MRTVVSLPIAETPVFADTVGDPPWKVQVLLIVVPLPARSAVPLPVKTEACRRHVAPVPPMLSPTLNPVI